MASWIVLIAAFRLVAACQAGGPPPRDPHAAQPERPTVATHAGTVAPGWVEIEAGGEFDRYEDHTRGAVAPIVAKIGIAQRMQATVFGAATHPPGSGTAVGDIGVGLKWRLADDAPVLGRFAILPSIKFPTGSSVTGAGTGTTDTGLVLISSHDLGPVAMDINAGYTRRSGSGTNAPRNATVWTVSFGGPAAGPVGWAAEIYGYPATAGPAGARSIVALLFGPTFTVRSWLVLDAGAIAPLSGAQRRAVYAGVTSNAGRLWRAP